MALDFTGSGNEIDCGSAAELDNVLQVTYWAWYQRPSSAPGEDAALICKGNFHRLTAFAPTDGTSQNASCVITRATDGCRATADRNDDPILQEDKWLFTAGVLDTSGVDADQKLYIGDLSTPAREPPSYSTQKVGSGTPNDNASAPCRIGNISTGSWGNCIIAWAGISDQRLTVDQIRALQWTLMPPAGSLVHIAPGLHGTGTQPDYSGNGNDGTIGGSPTLTDHVPVFPGWATRRPQILVPVVAGATFSETLTEGVTASDSPTQTIPQFLRPDGDLSPGSWTDEGGATTDLFDSIDEVSPNDSDYVEGP